ncbi:AraC family transcriptional regulator [Streptomyces sp. NBC_01020]|uniref:helix-turn-helix domain-containing protein n=1 Tax=Streptomyces sp. NBC_01020 TaxID=2903722 RepID=UPI0038636548|nr:AraC family transcriptional regulator [Streptomyces sp. NBC_01020]
MPGWSRYLTPAAAHWGLGLVCLGAGGQSGHIGTVRERVLSSHAVVLVTAGRGRCNGRAVGPPALFHLLAGVPHTYGPDRHGWSEQWALYDGPAAGAYAELGYLPAEVTPLADAASAALLFTRLRRALDRPDPETASAAALHELITALGRPRVTHPVLVALARNSALPLAVTARELSLSAERLRSIVRHQTGHGPKEYVQRLRINRAKELLAETDLTVVAISRRTGFNDPGYFTRQFTRRTGVTPSAFRTQQQRG